MSLFALDAQCDEWIRVLQAEHTKWAIGVCIWVVSAADYDY